MLATPGQASASDWATSFPESAATAHANAQGKAVVVLAVDKAARPAAAALRAALQGEGAARTVRNGKTIGSLKGLDDPAILVRAKALGAERYLIVRVFDDLELEAVVSVYDASGATIGGFSARPGEAIAAPRERLSGHDEALAASIVGVGEEFEENAEAFDKRRVVFDESLVVVSNGSTATVSRRFHPRVGDGSPLAGADFYAYVGRDDLAQQYKQRRGTRVGLGIGAVLGTVTGLGVMLGYGLGKGLAIASRSCDGEYGSPMRDMCDADNDAESKRVIKIGMGVGGGLLLGGIVLSVVAARIDPHPVNGPEALGLAEGFNDSLRRELGLPKRNKRTARASVSAGPSGAGMQLRGRF